MHVYSNSASMRAFWRSPTLQFKSFLRHLHGERATSQNAPSQRKVLFSGQGSQYVGMTSKLPQTHAVDSIYAAASSVLGYDLRALCLEGPQERLNETIHCQPAVVVGSLAALEELKSRDQSKFPQGYSAVAGFSVGEFAALISAGAFSVQTGLKLVDVRARAMQDACQKREGGMVTVIGLEEQLLRSVCHEANEIDNEIACIANLMLPRGFVVSGSKNALKHVRERCKEEGATTVKELRVSGAFHSPLMSSAVPKLRDALNEVPIEMPKISVYSNVTGRPYSSVEEIRTLLADQVVQPVQWLATITNMIDTHGVDGFAEVGPGKQLKSMLGSINKTAFKSCENYMA